MSVVKSHENYSLESAKKQFMVVDDFLGRLLRDEWAEAGAAGGSTALQDGLDGGVVRLTTGAVDGDYWVIYWSNLRSLTVAKKVIMEVRARVSHSTYIKSYLHLYYDSNNGILIYSTEVAGGAINWRIRAVFAGVATDLNSGVALDTLWHIFRIECHTHGANHVHFYIDGVETANSPISTNIPTSYLQPNLEVDTRTNAARYVDIDYVVIKEDR